MLAATRYHRLRADALRRPQAMPSSQTLPPLHGGQSRSVHDITAIEEEFRTFRKARSGAI